MHENRETSSSAANNGSPAGEGLGRNTGMNGGEESDGVVVSAEQHIVQESSSPSGARMRSAISERGGNASRARERKVVWSSLNGHESESRKQAKADLEPRTGNVTGHNINPHTGQFFSH